MRSRLSELASAGSTMTSKPCFLKLLKMACLARNQRRPAIGFPWINLILSEIRSLDGKWFAVLTRFIPNQVSAGDSLTKSCLRFFHPWLFPKLSLEILRGQTSLEGPVNANPFVMAGYPLLNTRNRVFEVVIQTLGGSPIADDRTSSRPRSLRLGPSDSSSFGFTP